MVPTRADPAGRLPVERVQLGVRMEKRLVKVLKALAEFEGVTLGQLLEKIVLHSFEPAPGHEGELSASPHGKKALAAIADLKRVYEMDFNAHTAKRFQDLSDASSSETSPEGERRAGGKKAARRRTSS